MISTLTKDDTASSFKKPDNDQDGLHNAANHAGQNLRSAFSSASHEISHASEVAAKEIRTNPVRSSMIALGVGVVLGVLLRR